MYRARLAPSTPRRPYSGSGFTLVELMVVILISAILLGVGVPALQNLVGANQLAGQADSLASALSEARSEAAKLNASVTVTPNTGGWAAGWTMAVVNGGASTGMPSTLRTGSPLPGGFSLSASTSVTPQVTFDSTGRANTAGGFLICQGAGPGSGGASKMVLVAASGSIRVAQNDSSGNPIDASGTSISGCTVPY